VAAGEFESAWFGAMPAEGVQHLAGERGEHGGVVLAVDHESDAAGAHAALDVGHGADGSPIFAKLVDSHMVAKALPDVVGGHTLADDVGIVGGDVEKTAGADAFVVDESDVANGRSDAGPEDAEFGIALLLKPVEAAASVLDGLAVGLKREADIGATDLVGALMAVGHAVIVIGHAHLEHSDPHALNPAAKAVLALPFGVPVGQDKDSRAGPNASSSRAGVDGFVSGKELGVDGVVFRPGRFDGTGKGENVFAIKVVIGSRRGGVPFGARLDGFASVFTDELGGIGVLRGAADVFKAPVKGLNATVVVCGPAAVLVAADFAFEPVHAKSQQFTVYSQQQEKKKPEQTTRGAHPSVVSANSALKSPEKKALGMRHEGGGVC
jgi:hypothetical protein